MNQLPPLPEQTEPSPGRIAWPAAVRYWYWCPRLGAARAHDLPPHPTSGLSYRVSVLNLVAYDLLVATGRTQDERHTGGHPRVSWANQHDKPVA